MTSKLLRVGYALTKNLGQIRQASAVGGAVSQGFLQELAEEKDSSKFDQHFINYFNRPEIDNWELRKGLTELHLMDAIPEPKVVEAALRACRRINDFALSIRFLESIKIKCQASVRDEKAIYAYIINEVKPVLDELGINTLEDLGYDKPELFLPESDWWWENKWYKEYGYDKLNSYKDINFNTK